MKNVSLNYAIVGGFVLIMLVVLVGVVALLTGRTGSVDTYYTHFPNVTGIKYGTKVTFEGFVIGQVEEIDPLIEAGQTRFQLRLSVKKGWPIPKDSLARITASGLLSAVIVDIKGGASPDVLQAGAEIPGGGNANLFAAMSDVAGQMSDIGQTALKPLLITLNAELETLQPMLQQQAPQLLANLVAVSGDLAQKGPRITADVQHMTATLSTQVVNDANAQRLAQTLTDMQQATHKLDATLTNLDRMVAGNQGTIDASLKDLRYTLQTVARSIDSVTYNLEGTTRNFNEFSRQLRDNPGILLGGRRTDDGPAAPK